MRQFYLANAINEFDYVLDRTSEDFILLPEVLLKKGENLIRLGKGPSGVFVLKRATEAILANPNYDESKQDRSFMSVHMKGGKTCPRCGHRISQIGSNREPLNFCRGCQL